ncbi:UNVERIFIED_ORG: restriction endonuclease S subunit [Bacillus sp. B2I3]|nr:restriction endonuclease S subunit [Bacillus sp. B2I3]
MFALFGGFVIRGKKHSDYHPYFLKPNLESPNVRNQISSKAGGSTRFNVSQSILSSIEISIPSQNEQEKVADFISHFDKKIQLQQKNRLAKRTEKRIYTEDF